MRKNQKRDELARVRWGMVIVGLLLLGVAIFYFARLWLASLITFIILILMLSISFIVSLFPGIHSKEYDRLNRMQKVFATSSSFIDIFGYLSTIG